MYPSHTQYVLTLRSTLIRFPFLREKYGSGYDALLESLRNKFKKERRPLINSEEVSKMKEKYSARHSGRKRGGETEEVCLQKRSCEQVSLDSAEDLRSILQHIEVLQQEHHKARPSFDIILQRLDRTKTYRQHYIQNHTTAELLGEMKRIHQIDADKAILAKMGEFAPKLLEKAPKGALKDTCPQTLQSCEDEQERKAHMVNAAIVLLPSFFKENPAFLFVNDQVVPQ
ncbi:uncharacterized protein LOC132868874 [Neoarius graeffei]|uniref:uncharacterized protein LOC132868874 n=1 Tax=Neoarius graeffei TaxID=443677 RepID=UPI00298D031A|nr:uncharacterized protein LOC132868874 [Neoarius graeffei]